MLKVPVPTAAAEHRQLMRQTHPSNRVGWAQRVWGPPGLGAQDGLARSPHASLLCAVQQL